MDAQDHEQLQEVEDEDQKRRKRPFPVKYLAEITKLMTSTTVVDDEACAAAFGETLGVQDGAEEDLKDEEEEYLKKLEVLVKQRLHELEEERGRQRQKVPRDRSIILGNGRASTSTSTTIDDHSGTSNGRSNEGGNSGGSFFRKQVLPADNEIQVEDEEDQETVDVPSSSQTVKENNELQLHGFVYFPNNVLFPRKSYWICNSPEGLVFSNVVDDLYTICLDAANSYSFEGVLDHLLHHVISRFTHFQTVLSGTFNIEPAVVIEWLREVTDAAIDTMIIINDLIVKKPRLRGLSSKKITRGKSYHPMNYTFLVLLTSFFNNDYSRARRVAIKKLKSIHDKMAGQYIEDVLHRLIMHSTARISGTNRAIRTSEMEPITISRADKYDHIVSREEDTEMILKHLMSKDKRVQVISLVGMLGTGKTALAHRIYSQYSVVRRFDIFAWAQSGRAIHFLTDTWSEILDKTFRAKVIDQMHQLKREMDATSGDLNSWLRHPKIFDILSNHRYLIIIDDIATSEDWYEARRVLPMDTMNGSRILLTTRDTRVALDAIHDQTGSPPPHQLGPLSDSESWELFTMKVRPLGPLPLELVSIGKEIVKKCDGLPFAIEHLADHLSTQETTYDAWFDVLESANKQLDNYHTPWSYILNMIVKDLWLNVKWCLFYLGLFPKKYAIKVRRLIALWVAEGFPVQSETSTLEYQAEAYLQELINRNMVQVTKQKSNGKPNKCCLTNYLREHLSIRGNQTNFASNTSESSTSRSTKLWVRRLADNPEVFNRASAMPEPPDSYRLLLTFLSFDYREGYEPGERVRNLIYGGINKGHFELLRVLDLEGVYKPGLPKEIGKLIHLMYLGLRWTYLDSFPSFVGNSINLQTLYIKHTYISTLPGSIWKL